MEAQKKLRKQRDDGGWIYVAAYYALQKMMVVCTTEVANFEEGTSPDEIFLHSNEPSPETIAIRNDLKNNLSEEAKFVIDLLVKEEFEEEVFSKKTKKEPTKLKLRGILKRKYQWTRLKLNRTFKELQEYAKEL